MDEEKNYSTNLLTKYLREKLEKKRKDNEETKKLIEQAKNIDDSVESSIKKYKNGVEIAI